MMRKKTVMFMMRKKTVMFVIRMNICVLYTLTILHSLYCINMMAWDFMGSRLSLAVMSDVWYRERYIKTLTGYHRVVVKQNMIVKAINYVTIG